MSEHIIEAGAEEMHTSNSFTAGNVSGLCYNQNVRAPSCVYIFLNPIDRSILVSVRKVYSFMLAAVESNETNDHFFLKLLDILSSLCFHSASNVTNLHQRAANLRTLNHLI